MQKMYIIYVDKTVFTIIEFKLIYLLMYLPYKNHKWSSLRFKHDIKH